MDARTKITPTKNDIESMNKAISEMMDSNNNTINLC